MKTISRRDEFYINPCKSNTATHTFLTGFTGQTGLFAFEGMKVLLVLALEAIFSHFTLAFSFGSTYNKVNPTHSFNEQWPLGHQASTLSGEVSLFWVNL